MWDPIQTWQSVSVIPDTNATASVITTLTVSDRALEIMAYTALLPYNLPEISWG